MSHNDLRPRLRGIFVLAATPMTARLDVDRDALRSNIQRFVDEGADGVVVGGTYAEYPSLRREERLGIFETAVEAVAGRVPVLCCTAASGTAEVIDLTLRAADLGADGAMVAPPYVHEVRDDDIVRHFTAIGEAVSLPIMLYHSTSIGVRLAPDLIARITALSNVQAVKQGSIDLHEQVRSLAAVGNDAAMFCGSDGVALASLAMGYAGCTSTMANFMAPEFVALAREIASGDLAAARTRFFRWQPVREAASRFGQPATVKAAMALRGLPAGDPRLPFAPLSADERRHLETALTRAGLLD